MAFTYFRNTAVDITEVGILTGLDPSAKATIRGYNIINLNTYPVYIKFYNDTTSNVTVGTTVPLGTLVIPADATIVKIAHEDSFYLEFDEAVTIAVTKFIANTDTTNITTRIHVELTLEDNLP